MADVIRIKRRTSGAPGAPATLANAELAYNEVDHTLYYGEGTGGTGGSATVVVPIGGSGQGSNAAPVMDGTAASGSSALWSRGDHVHPSDTSRYPTTNPAGYQTAAQVLAVRLDQFAAPAVDVTFNNHKITNVLDPVNPQDVATRNYVDTVSQGLVGKNPCIAATAGVNITLSGAQTIDGIAVVAGNRVLVKDQSTPATNGIYVVAAGAWTRATDMDVWQEVPAAFTFIEQGTVNADTGWLCTADPGGSIGTTPITWVQFSSAGQITAGNGLQKVGNTLNVVGTSGRIIVGPSVDIDNTYVGQASIVILGSVITGTWNATTIAVNHGGSGATSLTGYLVGNGTGPFTAVSQIPIGGISGLGTMASQNANAVAITGGTIDNVTLDGGTF